MELSLDGTHAKCPQCGLWKCLHVDTMIEPDVNGNPAYDKIICLGRECNGELGIRKDVPWLMKILVEAERIDNEQD